MSAFPKPSPQAYLEQERLSETKHEYISGEVFTMSGGSPEHNLICANIIRELGMQLKKRPCRVYTSDQRILVSNGYVYPDVSISCGEPMFNDTDNLCNPTLLVEVLSPSTADYDADSKFACYRQLVSLQEYLLIAQDCYQLIYYARQTNNRWLLTEYTEQTATLILDGIDCTLAMIDVYEKVFDQR